MISEIVCLFESTLAWRVTCPGQALILLSLLTVAEL